MRAFRPFRSGHQSVANHQPLGALAPCPSIPSGFPRLQPTSRPPLTASILLFAVHKAAKIARYDCACPKISFLSLLIGTRLLVLVLVLSRQSSNIHPYAAPALGGYEELKTASLYTATVLLPFTYSAHLFPFPRPPSCQTFKGARSSRSSTKSLSSTRDTMSPKSWVKALMA